MKNTNTKTTTTNSKDTVSSNNLFYSPEEVIEMEKKEAVIIEDIQNSLNQIEEYDSEFKSLKTKHNQKSIIQYITLGKILLNAKVELGNRFNTVVNEEVISQKQIFRYIRFVMTIESQREYDKSVKAKKEDVSLAKMDERITSLTEKSIEKFENPSMKKLIRMKTLSKTDFKKVIGGNNKPYDTLMADLKKQKDDEIEKKKNDEIPENMDKDTFNKLIDLGVYELIRKLQSSLDRESELKQQLSLIIEEKKTLESEIIRYEAESKTTANILNHFIPTQSPTIFEKAV